MREKPLHPAATMLCRSCRKEYQWGEVFHPYCSQACLEVEEAAAALQLESLKEKMGFLEGEDEERLHPDDPYGWTPSYNNPDNA